MKIKVDITLTMGDDTEEERTMQVQIEESIPEGFQNLDLWEQNVRDMGFQTMRSLFRSGIELYEQVKDQLSSEVKVIMMSAIDDGNLVLDFIKKGVRDYVVKDEKVINTLISVIEGEDDIYFDD